MKKFNLQQYCIHHNIDFETTRSWLKEFSYPYSFRRTLNLNKKKHDEIVELIGKGLSSNFSKKATSKLQPERVKKLNPKTILKQNELKLEQLIKSKEKLAWEKPSKEKAKQRLIIVENEIIKIHKDFQRANNLKMLKYHSDYSNVKTEKKKLEKDILSHSELSSWHSHEIEKMEQSIDLLQREIEIIRTKVELQEKEKNDRKKKKATSIDLKRTEEIELTKKKDAPTFAPNLNVEIPDDYITIPWNDIAFYNGQIAVRIGNVWAYRFPLAESRSSFNKIRAAYEARNIPNLRIQFKNGRIEKIENKEVLLYIIEQLKNTAKHFNVETFKNDDVCKRFRKYTKTYYGTYLKELFIPKCFNLICEITDNNIPIIPVPELVLSSSGQEQIHDSFLFPIIRNSIVYWVWESVEESKATYVFKTSLINYEQDIQKLYNFLTSDFKNKRSTLISNSTLKERLLLKFRFLHTDYNTWSRKIKQL